MQQLAILGSTGSIGQSTLDVIQQHSDKYQVFALVAKQNVALMLAQIKLFQPRYAVIADEKAATLLKADLPANTPTQILAGHQAIQDIVSANEVDIVMSAIVGAAGLLPTLAAIQAGKKVLLANKEALVMSGAYFLQQAQQHNATLLPVDSEHNAIFQCLPVVHNQLNHANDTVEKLILTASGGPFRELPLSAFAEVTPEQACAHPNWDMGQKISVDSATMMNKGLELIEAHWLFDMPCEKIDILVHKESIIHSLVAYKDGSFLAQLGQPDMRTPIAYALAWPERIAVDMKMLNLAEIAQLHFEQPDLQRFPCLQLAYQAVEQGGSASVVLNAANEVAVAAFLAKKIRFTDIAKVNARALEQIDNLPVTGLDEILYVDKETRRITETLIETKLH